MSEPSHMAISGYLNDVMLTAYFSREMERKVWELNSSSRKLRLSTTTSSVSQPVVTSKMCEVCFERAEVSFAHFLEM